MIVTVSLALSALAIVISIASIVLTLAAEQRVRENLKYAADVRSGVRRPIDSHDFVIDPDAPVRKFNVV